MNNPLVSIIIPTYNRAHLIGETLDSVLAQTYENWECIIVDDGSTDNSAEVIGDYVKRDGRFQYHKRPEDRAKGGNAARNYGFEVSKGEYVNWFDSDDIMLTEFLKTKVELFTPSLNFVITSGFNVDSDLSNLEKIELYQPEILFKDYVLWKLKILTPSVLIKRSVLVTQVHLFSEKITRGQEAEFFSRLFFKITAQEFIIVNIPLFLYRQHNETKTKQNNLYVNDFKSSETYFAVENFKKSVELNDFELINFFYIKILNFFFRALDYKHKQNSRYILKEFSPLLNKINFRLFVLFNIVGNIFVLINRGSYNFEKYLKLQIIK